MRISLFIFYFKLSHKRNSPIAASIRSFWFSDLIMYGSLNPVRGPDVVMCDVGPDLEEIDFRFRRKAVCFCHGRFRSPQAFLCSFR